MGESYGQANRQGGEQCQGRCPKREADSSIYIRRGGKGPVAQAVGGWFLQCDGQRAGGGRHRPASVGAGGQGEVAEHRGPGGADVGAGGGNDGEGGQRRGDEVGEVVEAGGELAEVLERAVAIAQHRVGGV